MNYNPNITNKIGNITTNFMSEDARDLLDKIMEEWEIHIAELKKQWPDKKITFYQFAYWLVRWSNLIKPM